MNALKEGVDVRSVDFLGDPARRQAGERGVEPAHDPGAMLAEVVVPFGQQAQRETTPLARKGDRSMGQTDAVPIYGLTERQLTAVPTTTYSALGRLERQDLQQFLKADIGVIASDVLIVAEEFGEWEDARRRIDLLGVDRQGRLVVIELKRTEDGGHVDLQALRYAAMVSTMTFDQLADTYQSDSPSRRLWSRSSRSATAANTRGC